MTIFKDGQAVGPYRIVRCIGRGGMGEVYEVAHARLGVHYALKAFAYRGGTSRAMLRVKFMEEGQVLARLRHPNLVRMFDLSMDSATGVAYYVMDLVLYKDGCPYTLADVERSSVDEDYLFIWFRDLCNALDYIHSKGVVHRDVKLNNILLNSDKHVTLSDFGVAHIFGDWMAKAAGACPTGAFDATGERTVLGTSHYTAPEVAAGTEATPAADTYALGVAMFKLLTGGWYEPGMDARALLTGCRWKYRWAEILPEILATEPKDRPQILAQSVIGLVPGKGFVSAAAGERRKRVWPAVACVGAALVVLGGLCAALMAWRSHEADVQKELARHRAEIERLRQEERKAQRKAEDEEQVTHKAEEEPNRTKEIVSDAREMEDSGNPQPDIEKADMSKTEAATENAKTVKAAETPKASERPGKEYRWHDGSGEPLEVLFEVGGASEMRLLPFKVGDSAFWMSRLPVTVAAWRAVKGGYEGLDSMVAALPAECPLCVVADRTDAEVFCRAMTERFRTSLPKGYEIRLATADEMYVARAEDETAKLCEATGRSADDCVGATGAVARARFRRVKADCRLERFGDWTADGELAGKQIAVAGLPMPRASGVVGLCADGEKPCLRHLVIGRKTSGSPN